jgi:hypothetical protein
MMKYMWLTVLALTSVATPFIGGITSDISAAYLNESRAAVVDLGDPE